VMLGGPSGEGGLAGSGLIVANPPFTLEPELRVLLPALTRILSKKAASSIDWLARER
jgi:23S rRNA (adenine2030-N6)-methyltransferase